MAVNRYVTREFTPYVDTFVPLPLDLIDRAGAMKQNLADKTKKDLSDSVLENIKSIEEHDPYRNKYVQDFNSQVQALIADPNMDFASSEGKSKVYNLIKQHANNPYVQTLARSIDNKKQTLEDWSAVQKAGKGAYWNDPTLQDEKLKSIGINPYLNADGTPKEYERKIAYSTEDHNKPVYDLFDKMKDDADVNAWANFTGDKTAIQTGKKGWEGIDAPKVQLIADANIDSFKTTQGGQDFLRKFNFDNAEQLYKLTPELRSKYEDEAVRNHLYNIGNAYIHNKKTEDANLKSTALLSKKYEEEKDKPQFTTETGVTETTGDWTKTSGLDKYFNEDGTIKTTGVMDVLTSSLQGTDDTGMSQTGLSIDKNQKVTKNINKQTDEALSELYKRSSSLGLNVKKPNGEIDGAATKQNLINYYKALSVYSNHSVPFINKDIVKNISSDLFGKTTNFSNMEIYEQGDKSTKSKYENDDSKKEFKGSKVIGLDYTADSPGAFKIVKPLADGEAGDKPYIAISRNVTLQDQMRPVQELTKKSIEASKTGTPDKNATFITNMLKNSTVTDETGNKISFESLGIPVAYTIDRKSNDIIHRISYLDTSSGIPYIRVLEKSNSGGTSIKSLDQIQQEKTSEIFNTKGALSGYQKQSTKEQLPSQNFEEEQ